MPGFTNKVAAQRMGNMWENKHCDGVMRRNKHKPQIIQTSSVQLLGKSGAKNGTASATDSAVSTTETASTVQ